MPWPYRDMWQAAGCPVLCSRVSPMGITIVGLLVALSLCLPE